MNPFDLAQTANLPIPLESGHWISERTNRIIELVREYDERLDVAWIPPDKRDPRDPAFAIMERTPDGRQHIVFYVQDEDAFDGSVLERLYETDAAKHGNILSKIDARNQAVRAIARKQYEEQMEEANEVAHSILRSPKSTYRHNGMKFE